MATINAGDKAWDDKVTPKSLPDGEHVVFVAEAFPDVSKGQGTPFVEVTFQVHDPASKFKGKTLKFQRFWTSEKAMPRFIRFLRACGATKPFDAENQKAVEEALLDRMLRITVKTSVEEYKGEKRNKSEAAFFAPLTPADKARLVEEYGETMLPPLDDGAADKGGNYDGQAAASGEYADDDIPF